MTNTINNTPKMMSPNEVATYTGIPISIIRKMIRDNTLPTYNYRGRYYVITEKMMKVLGLEG